MKKPQIAALVVFAQAAFSFALAADLHSPGAAIFSSEPWIGTWKFADATIRIEKMGNGLKISGVMGDLDQVDGWQGEFSGIGSPKRGVVFLDEGMLEAPCQVRLRLLKRRLIVWSNAYCGGPHANFTGQYTRE